MTTVLASPAIDRPSSSHISTWTGKLVDVLDLQLDDIDIADIGHALARQCRYNGHCDNFLSVARHSIWVSNRIWNAGFGRELSMWGLLHDASEAYVGDMVAPLKHHPSMAIFVETEERVQQVIAQKFDLPWPMPQEVHDSDKFVTHQIELRQRARNSQNTTPNEDEAAFFDRYDFLMDPW